MNATRILAVALVLCLSLAPFAAASDTYASITLNNFHFELGKDKPVNVNASVKVGYGGNLPDGPVRLDATVQGGDKTAFSGSATLEDGTLRTTLDKSKYYFQLPMADFEKAFYSEAKYEMRYAPMHLYSFGINPYDYYNYYDYYGGNSEAPTEKEDIQKLFDLLGRYVNLLEKYSDDAASKELDRKLLAQLNLEAKGMEKVKIFGKTISLYRFDIVFEEKDFHKYTDALYAAEPEYKALDEEFTALMEKMEGGDEKGNNDDQEESKEGASEETAEEELPDTGLEKLAFTYWSDTEVPGDPASKVRKCGFLLTVKDAVDEYGMPIKLEIPITTTTQTTDKGTRTNVESYVAPYKGESLKVIIDSSANVPVKGGGISDSFKASLDFDSNDEGVVLAADVTGSKTVDADGVVDFDANAKGKFNGQSFSFDIGYDGKTNTENEKSGTMSLSYNIPTSMKTGGGMPSKALVRFDILIEQGPLTPTDTSALKDLQPVNPLRASYTAMDKVSGDMYGALMQGVGVLMQTRGLSAIIGGMMNAA